LLNGKRAICYPGFENELKGATVESAPVVTDGSITTAIGMGAALPFSLELVRLILGEEKAKSIADAIQDR
jgi:4-methyl-5(b-hydroxyethyl)-thiazole monophosphate biosynthesis